jgi:hypothetical protein
MPSKNRPEKKGKLDSESLKRFVARLYEYPEQKERVMNDLLKLGFCATVSEYFVLNAHQKRELQTVRDRDAEVVFTDGVLAALRRNGKIELIQEGHNPPNMRFFIGFERGDDGKVRVVAGVSC